MRSLFLALILNAVPVLAQTKAPSPLPPVVTVKSDTPQAALPPNVNVKLDTPPVDRSWRLVELAVQGGVGGLFGGLLALGGVWLSNRTNRQTAEANRRHELEKLDQQRRDQITKDAIFGFAKEANATCTEMVTMSVAGTPPPQCIRIYTEQGMKLRTAALEVTICTSSDFTKLTKEVVDILLESLHCVASDKDELDNIGKASTAIRKYTNAAKAYLRLGD